MSKPGLLLALHRWIALAFAPLLLLQAATGAVLLFRDELAQAALPASPARSGGNLPLSALANAASASRPDLRLTRLFFPATTGSAALAQLEGAGGEVRYAAIDPSEGQVILSGSIWRFPMEVVLQVHFRLMSGSVGLAVVALNGLALAALAMSGLWHWWPGASRVAQALAMPVRSPQRLRLRAWHRSVGAMLSFVLLTSSATGILLAVPNLPLPQAADASPEIPVDLDAQAIDRGFAMAQAAYPGASPRDVRFGADGSMKVNFLAPRGGRWAVDVATVQPGSQSVAALPLEQNQALWLTVLPIHTGDLIGPAGRWPMLAAALALVFLALSGPLSWWRSTRKGKPR